MQLYNVRNKIIKLFEDKDISPSIHACDAKSEPKEYEVKESEQKFEESIGERVKLKRQKADNDEEKPDATNMSELETKESAEQRRNKKGQGLKILTPNQMLSRLPISLAQLKAANNSEKLKNEIRQLFYSLYRPKKLSKTVYKHLMNAI